MSKILVLGGSGIISKEIVELAVKKQHDLTIVNRGIHGNNFSQDVKIIIADLKNEDINEISNKLDKKYDVVMDFISYRENELSRNLSIVANKFRQYIFISTATVYSLKEGRISENDDTNNDMWDYAINKKKCEQLLKQNAETGHFAYTIVRPYITYGKTRIPLQFAPLEYYTIVNRMLCKKPIPVYHNDVKCTLTSSKDFAVAAVDLIDNINAFSKSVNIIGQYETTWNKALEEIACAFGIKEYSLCKLSLSLLSNKKLTAGLNVDEVIGDKSRDMLFDNSFIHNLSQNFKGDTTLKQILPDIVEYYKVLSHRKINYSWDGRVDYLLAKSGELSTDDKKTLYFKSSEKHSMKDYISYMISRYQFLYITSKLVRKIIR